MDAAIGRILEALRRLGFEDDTVVIFASDNGYFLGDRGYADKWTMHEQSIRVPCIVKDGRHPAARQGRVLRDMVLNVDIPPTIVAMAGIPVPERMQGRSLSALLAGSDGSWRREIFTEHLWKHPEIPRTEAVRTERWKYIRYPDHPEYEELYDLAADTWETRNLARESRERQRIAEFRRRCDEWIRRVS
jgi:arylsulfatase A-like enzyme